MIRLDITVCVEDTENVAALSDHVDTVVGRAHCESGFGFGERDLGYEFPTRAAAYAAASRVLETFGSKVVQCRVEAEELIFAQYERSSVVAGTNR